MEKWYGKNAKPIRQIDSGMVVDYGCGAGKGVFTVYEIFSGVWIGFMDFDTPETIAASSGGNDQLFQVTYCLRGRFECEFPDRRCVCIGEGDVAVNGTRYIPVSFSFPLNVFYGIGVIIDRRAVSGGFGPILSAFSIDLEAIYKTLRLDSRWYTEKADPRISRVFAELYTAGERGDLSYLGLKTVELLYCIGLLTGEGSRGCEFCSGAQVRKVKRIRDQLLEQADTRPALERVVEKHNMRKKNTVLEHF
jgi:hypothetical protein